jgi:ABC-2 type transport system permease protein
MTAGTTSGTTPGTVAPPPRFHRIRALGRAEALLLWRNPVALITALVFPAMMTAIFASSGIFEEAEGLDLGEGVVMALAATTLLFVVYYNLVTALVARREDLVLKRLRTGEATDAEILAGTALPSVLLGWAQIVVATASAIVAFGVGVPVNAALVVAGLVLGTVVFVLLAAASTAVTRNVEMAQVTTMPVLLGPLAFSGLFFPLDELPGPLTAVATAMPLTPVVDLLRLGLVGVAADGTTVGLAGSFRAAALPLALLCGWIYAGVWATRRWFRWDPRR